jgi:hypothetical protein
MKPPSLTLDRKNKTITIVMELEAAGRTTTHRELQALGGKVLDRAINSRRRRSHERRPTIGRNRQQNEQEYKNSTAATALETR